MVQWLVLSWFLGFGIVPDTGWSPDGGPSLRLPGEHGPETALEVGLEAEAFGFARVGGRVEVRQYVLGADIRPLQVECLAFASVSLLDGLDFVIEQEYGRPILVMDPQGEYPVPRGETRLMLRLSGSR